MRTCPHCGRNYPDEYSFCLDDGEPLSVLDGRKTDLIKGPYTPGGTTEHIPAKTGSEETVVLPPADIPGPTEPSPLPTIRDRGPRPVVEAAPRGIQRSHSAGTTRFAIGAILVLCVIGLAVFLSQYGSGVSITSGQSANANLPQTRPNNPANGVTAPSNSQPVVTQPVDSQPGGDQPVSEPPAGQPPDPISATGRTEADTLEFPVDSRDDNAFINSWFVKEGDFYDPCNSQILFRQVTHQIRLKQDATTENVERTDEIKFQWPAMVLKIYMEPGQTYYRGRTLVMMGRVEHLHVDVKLDPAKVKNISKGTGAFFTETGSTQQISGSVESVNKASGAVRVKIDDNQVFGEGSCLKLKPGRSGIVRFSVP